MLGVNAKNFLNVFQKARELSDFEKFKAATDGLARRFVSEFVGKAFDVLAAQPEFTTFLARVNKVVTSYEQVEDRAVALFDCYFDRLETLTGFLDRSRSSRTTALDTLRKELTPELWKMLAQLTDGDPLGFLLRQVTVGGRHARQRGGAEEAGAGRARADSIRRAQGDSRRDRARQVELRHRRLLPRAGEADTVEELEALANERSASS